MFHYALPQLYALSTQEGKLVLRLEIVAVYRECGSIRETARRLSVSRNTVREVGAAVQGGRGSRALRPPAAAETFSPPHPTGGRGEGA